jgi:hypothetical protein
MPLPELLAIGSAHGAAALGLGAWPPAHANLAHPSLQGVAPDDVPAALVFSCSADVFSN